MAEQNYPIPENPVYDPNIRALQDSDPASASSVFNPLLVQLISNIHAVKLLADDKADGDSMQVALQNIANTFNTINTALNGKAASNHTHAASQVGAAAANHGHNAATAQAAGFMVAADKSKLDGIAAKATANAASTTVPQALGTASAGKEVGFARGDHVHPKPSLADLGAAASNHGHTAAQIGAAAASHSHTKSQITDFPSSMAPTAHNHSAANITSGILPIARGGLGNDSGYVRVGQKAGTTIGGKATAEGSNATASGLFSHAEGLFATASEQASHAEGNFATASGEYSHAEGTGATASEQASHAEGNHTTASGQASHAEGRDTTASGYYSHAEGFSTTASNYASHACGKYSRETANGGNSFSKVGDVFVIGNGVEKDSRSNAFRVTYTGQKYGLSTFNTSGADYAEYFEWLDANPDNEDRVGFFVTMECEKIRKANNGDYILGIVSANPCIIGNADEDWLGRWEHDEFGRFKIVEVETPATEMRTKEVPVLDEAGNPTGEIRIEIEEVATGEVIKGWDYKANPDYDPKRKYIERKDRPEWSAIGMVGVLAVRDDGSCQVNGFCQCADSGIATAAEQYIPCQTYRVIARVTENIVKVVFR